MLLLLLCCYGRVFPVPLWYFSRHRKVRQNELWQFLDLGLSHLQNRHRYQTLHLPRHHPVLHLWLTWSLLLRLLRFQRLLPGLLEFLHLIQGLNNLTECQQGGVRQLHNLCILVVQLLQHSASNRVKNVSDTFFNAFCNANFAFTR